MGLRVNEPEYFMNCRHEAVEMGVQPDNPAEPREPLTRDVLEQYVAGSETRGRQEVRPYPRSQSRLGVIHEISGPKQRDGEKRI